MELLRPITPAQVVKQQGWTLPRDTVERLNDLIVLKWDGVSAYLWPDDVAGVDWYEVRNEYRKFGWEVSFVDVCGNETWLLVDTKTIMFRARR